jgi:DNA-binding MarR family transcriptional regulator
MQIATQGAPMKHKPELTPTARLIMSAISHAGEPLSISNLCEKTYGSPYTVNATARRLVKKGKLMIIPIEGVLHFVVTPSALVVL